MARGNSKRPSNPSASDTPTMPPMPTVALRGDENEPLTKGDLYRQLDVLTHQLAARIAQRDELLESARRTREAERDKRLDRVVAGLEKTIKNLDGNLDALRHELHNARGDVNRHATWLSRLDEQVARLDRQVQELTTNLERHEETHASVTRPA